MAESNNLLPQSAYDDNRNRFDADMKAVDLDALKARCDHYVERIGYGEVRCKKCLSGWYDNHRFELRDGKIINIA